MKLQLEQKQELQMTPRLRMAIEMLQYNNQELKEYLQQQLAENPMLEQQEEQEWEEKLQDHYQSRGSYTNYAVNNNNQDSFESYTAYQPKLLEHLEQQLYEVLAEEEIAIGEAIIGNLTTEGFLDISLELLAQKEGVSLAKVQQILFKIQRLDPPGIASRNVKESLLIQLEAIGGATELASKIISNHWQDLSEVSLEELADELSAQPSEVLTALEKIKGLQPRPAEAYHNTQSKTSYINPDMIISKRGGELVVELNDGYQPGIHISPRYYELLSQSDNPETVKYLKKKFKSALWLIKALENRRMTLTKIGRALIDKQQDFFDEGIKSLQPLTMKEVAAEINRHESTVSRAIRGKYVQTPSGLFTLKFFFASGVGQIASASIKALIKEYIYNEPKDKTLSDNDIANLLQQREGLEISRRTVAKYRQDLNIPSSTKRKKWEPK